MGTAWFAPDLKCFSGVSQRSRLTTHQTLYNLPIDLLRPSTTTGFTLSAANVVYWLTSTATISLCMLLLSRSLLKSRAFLFFSIFVWAKYVSWAGYSRSTLITQNRLLFATGYGHSKTLITQLDLQIELFQRLTKDRVSSVDLNETWRVAAARQCSLRWVVGETVQRS